MELTDIVFENRNKEYGAYKIRKKYARTLFLSFSITIMGILIFTGYSIAYKFFTPKPLTMPKGVVFEPTYLSLEDIAAPEIPELKPIQNEPLADKLNEVPIVSDSVKNVAKKEELPKETKEAAKDTSASGGAKFGVANGDIMVAIQKYPEFPGGEEARALFIRKNFNYGNISKSSRVRGTVLVSFRVRATGVIDDIKISKSLNPELDRECMRVIGLMPPWKPAISGGHPVDIYINFPILL